MTCFLRAFLPMIHRAPNQTRRRIHGYASAFISPDAGMYREAATNCPVKQTVCNNFFIFLSLYVPHILHILHQKTLDKVTLYFHTSNK